MQSKYSCYHHSSLADYYVLNWFYYYVCVFSAVGGAYLISFWDVADASCAIYAASELMVT